ncbi:hypothetical protein B0H13DRAFT_2653618 [Mycena leptocephala]|nr:hypothetical protein B0H13DRAFT_2653618 [Mycena leptocephala]
MENDDHANTEFSSNAAGDHSEFSSASYHYGGGIFSGSHNFTVAGGTFNNVTKNYTSGPTVPSDFRMIPLGDIDLQHELRLNKGSAVVGCRRERASVRRVYSARIDGRNAPMTVAMYQGPGAEESPVLTVYIKAFCISEFHGVQQYLFSAFQTIPIDDDCTFWMRRSTGRLCADLVPGNFMLGGTTSHERPTFDQWQRLFSLNVPHMEAMVIDSLTLEQFHAIFCWDRSTRCTRSKNERTVHLGAILVKSGSDWDYLDEVVSSANIRIDYHAWQAIQGWRDTSTRGEVTEDGWTRFNSCDVSDDMRISLCLEQHSESWLSQANHIFSRLGITSDFTDYEVVRQAFFSIYFSKALEHCPPGYLFVCPAKDLQFGPSSFRWPDCPAYWSLDPSGAERLSLEEATELGFRSIEPWASIGADSWDADVYPALRQFHRAKGFDPDSQDVARHLGYPLYQLPTAMDALFAHVDDADFDSQEDNGDSVNTDADSENHVHESTATSEAPGTSLRDEMPVSRTLIFFMNIQGMLLLFLALSWLYNQWL